MSEDKIKIHRITDDDLPDLRDVYDMDEKYNLLSWHMPAIETTLRPGQLWEVDGEEMTITELSWSADMLGIHAVRAIFDDKAMINIAPLAMMYAEGKVKLLKDV